MTINLFDGLLAAGTLLTIASIVLAVVQIVLKSKINLLSFCKVSIYLPILAILIKITHSLAQAHYDISIANDLSESIWHAGLFRMFLAITAGLVYTLVLLIVYAITKTVYQNSKGQ